MGLKKQTETNTVLAQCRQLLDILQSQDRLRYWRANAGAGLRDGRPIRAHPEGTPDLLLILPFFAESKWADPVGRLVGVETKMPTKKRSAAQIAWANSMAKVGVEVWTIYDVKELEQHLKELGVM